MRLDAEGLKDRQAWEKAGYALPEFDREKVKEKTRYGFILEPAIFLRHFLPMWCRSC